MTHAELDERLAVLLQRYDVLPATMLAQARAYQQLQLTGDTSASRPRRCSTLAGALRDLHLVDEQTLTPLLEEVTGVHAVNPTLLTVYPDFVERMNILIPPSVIAALLVFPARMEINTIHVCMLNPTDDSSRRALEAISGCRIAPAVAHEIALRAAIEEHYAAYLNGSRTDEPDQYAVGVAERAYRDLLRRPFEEYLQPALSLINRSRDTLQHDDAALGELVREPALIRLVQQLLCRAIDDRASDVHVEPLGEELRIRVRVDGAMHERHAIDANAAGPIVARLKAMADLPIAPTREPLDGRIGYELVWGRSIDLRVSAVPSITGEKLALRVLDRSQAHRDLADLGMDSDSRHVVEEATTLPNGFVLVTGPTGSGKSSTLYAMLHRLNDGSQVILTAEDPIESRIPGITQVPCGGETGIEYGAALRSFLRQDPDVIMLGEIRDHETADIALRAGLTGHLVLSTLHTNDAPGAVLRLINMGLEPFLIASALRLVIAQRLVRRLCPACRRPMTSADIWCRLVEHLPASSRSQLEGAVVYDAVGCPSCGGTGYVGRLGIFETLNITHGIEELIVNRATAAEIRAAARAAGMRTLREAGLLAIAAGETTVAEILEHTMASDEAPAVVASR